MEKNVLFLFFVRFLSGGFYGREVLALKFTKMHGIGNDYVYVNAFEEVIRNPSKLAVRVSDRHFGIGSDGLILIAPSRIADFRMIMFNADGSEGKMCGNGIRCVGKYVYDHGMTDKRHLTIETGSGIRTLELFTKQGLVSEVCVDMGEPSLKCADIPVLFPKETMVLQPLEVLGETYEATCVSMGNPHCVIRVEDPDSMDLVKIGPAFEQLDVFPESVNTEFVRVVDRGTIRMRVWERGSQETLACGTGACASAVACAVAGWTGREAKVSLLGGDLRIRWDEETNHVFMTGEAVTVFEGDYQDTVEG